MESERKYIEGFEELSTTEFVDTMAQSPTWMISDMPFEWRFLLDVADDAGNHRKYCSPNLLFVDTGEFTVFTENLRKHGVR